jgi:hypothetical protein
MENAPKGAEEPRTISLRLCPKDFEILERFRGELSHDAFVSALLRMIDSGAVLTKPDWVKQSESK